MCEAPRIGDYIDMVMKTLLLAKGLGRAHRCWMIGTLITFAAWTLLAPLLMVPTSVDGGYERLVGLIPYAWTAAISVLLIGRSGRHAVGRGCV